MVITLFLIISLVHRKRTRTQECCLLSISSNEQVCNLTFSFQYTHRLNRRRNVKKGSSNEKGKNKRIFYDRHMVYWSERARHLTNNVRKKRGVKRLRAGTHRQLQNAVNHAQTLGRLGFLKHQNLRQVTKRVGCNRFVAGENIAYNYADGDLVATCMRQWIHSRTHYNNLVYKGFEEVVVGVFVHKRSGRIYCVQTFAMVRRGRERTGRGCRGIGR